jgi:cytochrome c biogenesis protein CcmG, thiol:disulfide interchange protein DsbE
MIRFLRLTSDYLAEQSNVTLPRKVNAAAGSMQAFSSSTSVIGRSTRRLGSCICLLLMSAISMSAVQADALLDLDGLRGRVVYLDFWASWCGPCRQSFPWMQTMKSTYENRGLTVVAVNLDMDRAAADRFLTRFHPTFDVRFDPSGDLAEAYKIRGMPSSVLIDRHGVARFTHVGFRPVDEAVYEAQVRELLAEK